MSQPFKQISWDEYKFLSLEQRKLYNKQKYLHFKELYKYTAKASTEKYKLAAYLMVGRGKLECICGCGCRDIRFLEINHKNGGGSKEGKTGLGVGANLWRRIALGKRTINDLELTCAPYNTVHKLMLKFGLQKPSFSITFTGVEST